MLSSLWNFDAHPITVDSPTRWVVGVAGETILDNGIEQPHGYIAS